MSKLWISSTRPLAGGLPANAMSMSEVSSFDVTQHMIRFADGQEISEVDHVLFCTGYQYHQPFIKKNSNTEEPLFPSGPHLENLHEHTIYIDKPTLAFLGIVRAAVPTFLLVQAQAAFISRFFSDQVRSLCPRTQDSQHRLPYPLFMDYLLRLESLCDQADKSQAWNVSRYTNPVFRWTCELDLVRTHRREIRDEFLAHSTQNTGIWSTTDMIHHFHGKFLDVRSNIRALLPFLVVSYGYNDDHGHKSSLPFQGWERRLGLSLVKPVLETCISLHSQLGPDSRDVITRGTRTLLVFLRDRRRTFSDTLTEDESRWEEKALEIVTSNFKKAMFCDVEIPAEDTLSCDDDVSPNDEYSVIRKWPAVN